MIVFREKKYNAKSEAMAGATLGSSIGYGVGSILRAGYNDPDKLKTVINNGSTAVGKFLSKFGPTSISKYLKGANKSFWSRLESIGLWMRNNPIEASITGALVGASLAVCFYIIKKSYNKVDRMASNIVPDLLDRIVSNLKKSGYKFNKDYTTDPAQADYMKTKVCMVISQSSSELCININSVDDPKLNTISKSIIKNLPGTAKYSKRESDKNNELTLTLISTGNDAAYITNIVEMFIKRKYPVFLLELN